MVSCARDHDFAHAMLTWRVCWAGFEAWGHTLQQHGWCFSELKDYTTFCSLVVAENKRFDVCLWGKVTDYEMREFPKNGHLQLGLRYCAREFILNTISGPPVFNPVDLSPVDFQEWQRYSYKNHSPFKSLIADAPKRIVVPQEQSVDELLARIIAMQQPAQTEYFNNKLRENKMPDAVLSAQIIQLRSVA